MENTSVTSKTPRRLLFIFEILALILMFTYDFEDLDKYTVFTGIGLVALVYISNIILSKISNGDHYIFLIATMLMSIGVMMIYRLDSELGFKQLIWLSVGIIFFYITYFIVKKIEIWDRLMYFYIILAYLLFVATLVFGTTFYGARNWLSIGGRLFQPAELIKIIFIFILACFYGSCNGKLLKNNSGKINYYGSYILMGMVYSFVALLFLQKDLGMALMFYGIFIVIQFIFEEDRKIIIINLILFILSAILGFFLFSHVRVRFEIWIDPWKYIDTTGYQTVQSLFAISEGGFFGTGLGMGNPELIPLAYNDFIFPAIVEEMGIFVGIGVIMLFMILVYRGFKIGMNQNNNFFKVLATGVSALFGVQSFVILGGVLNVIPLTGITLPFMAYGGTSVLSSFIALGVLQAASEEDIWKV